MRIVLDDSSEGKIVRVHVGKRLDLTAYKPFNEATTRVIDNPEVVAIVLDFSETHQLFDSGKAMLNELQMRARALRIPLSLVNAGPGIRHKLSLTELSRMRLYNNGDPGREVHKLKHAW